MKLRVPQLPPGLWTWILVGLTAATRLDALGSDDSARPDGAPISIVLQGHDALVSHVAFLNDGETMVSASQDNTIRIWDIERQAQNRILHCTTRMVSGEYARSWSSFGRTALFASERGVGGMIYQTLGGQVRWYPQMWQSKSDYASFLALDVPDLHFGPAVCSPDGRWMAAYVYKIATRAISVRVYDFERAAVLQGFIADNGVEPGLLHEWQVHDDPTAGLLSRAIQFSPDGTRLAVVGSGPKRIATMELWDVRQGERCWQATSEPGRSVQSFSFSPSGNRLVTATGSDTVEVRDIETGVVADVAVVRGQPIDLAICSPARDMLALAGAEGPVYLWSLVTRDVVTVLDPATRNELCDCAWSPDGYRLATAGGREGVLNGFGELRLWELGQGQAREKP